MHKFYVNVYFFCAQLTSIYRQKPYRFTRNNQRYIFSPAVTGGGIWVFAMPPAGFYIDKAPIMNNGRRRVGLWLVLALLSAAAAAVMYRLQLPGAFMLGPMLAAVVVAIGGAGLRVHRQFSTGALSIMGCLIAAFITPSLLTVYRDHWLALSAANIATLVLIIAVAALITRRKWLPDSTAVWGLFPGAASAMVLMADSQGSDPRIVAMMQYTRIVMVSVASIAMAALLDQGQVGVGDSGPLGLTWSASADCSPLFAGLALALSGYAAARLSGISSLALFLPAFGGAALQGTGLIRFEIPPFIFIPAFAVTGWYVGLMFTRSVIRHCLGLLPIMLTAIALVVFVCGLVSLVLARMLPGTDLLTAYLAMSPGGIETIVIIARDTNVYLPLILASQFLRLLIVLSIGPSVARAVVSWQSR